MKEVIVDYIPFEITPQQINKLIRDVVGDILRDIWLKRNAWK